MPPPVSLPDNNVVFGRGVSNSRLQSQHEQRVPARIRAEQHSPAVQLQLSQHWHEWIRKWRHGQSRRPGLAWIS